MQGLETDGGATQRQNKEANAEEVAKQEKLKAEYEANLPSAGKADEAPEAALEASKKQSWQLVSEEGELQPVETTKSAPFVETAQIPATPVAHVGAASAAAPAASAADAAAIPTPRPSPKRKENIASGSSRGGDNDDEMAEDGGDPSTLAQDVRFRKVHQIFKKFSKRLGHNGDQLEGQGGMVDEVCERSIGWTSKKE